MELISLILNFVLGSGIIGLLIFYRSKKRKASADATNSELTNSDKIIAQYDRLLDTFREESEINKKEASQARQEAREARSSEARERDTLTVVYKELSDARVGEQRALGALAIAEYDKCTSTKCLKREPPRRAMLENEITNP